MRRSVRTSSQHSLGQRRYVLSAFACVILLIACEFSLGQEPDTNPARPSSASGTTDESVTASEPAADPKQKVVYLRNSAGELVPVPQDATLEEFLTWRNSRSAPAWYVTSVRLTGSADDRMASLKAIIKVDVKRSDEWLRVPLGLTESVMKAASHSLPAMTESPLANDDTIPVKPGLRTDADASFDRYSTEEGYSWWLKGKGVHTLTLDLLVPVQKQIPGRRLLLTLPETPSSELNLTVPGTRITVTPPERSASRTSTEGKSSVIQIFGLPEKMALEWKPLPDVKQVKTQLQAFTSMSIDMGAEAVLLNAWQRVQVVQGSVQELQVTLPPGFEIIDVEQDGVSITPRITDPNRPDLVTVTLEQALVGQAVLKWVLSYPLPEQNREIILTDLRIASATRQTGELALRTQPGFRLEKRETESRFVYRIDSEELIREELQTFAAEEPVFSAYRYLKGDFRLVLELQEISPSFAARPELKLQVSEKALTLEGRFRFQVYRGGLQDVAIRWTDPEWVPGPVQSPELVEQVTIDEIDGVTVQRIRLRARQTQSFEIPIRATRVIPEGTDSLTFSLPGSPGTRFLPTLLTIALDENVELDLRAGDQTRLQQIVERQGQSESQRDYQITSAEQELTARLTIHDQEVTTRSIVNFSIENDSLLVEQRILYDVRYERLSEIRLNVPGTLIDRGLRYVLDNTTVPMTTLSGVDIGSLKQVQLELPEPRNGSIELSVTYNLPAPIGFREDDVDLSIPLIQSADAAWTSISFRTSATTAIPVKIVDPAEDWLSVPDSGSDLVWKTDQPQTAIALQMSAPTALSAERLRVPRALVLTGVDQQGRARTRIQYVVAGKGREFRFTLPRGLTVDSIWLGENEVPDARILRDDSDGQVSFTIQLTNTERSPLLTDSNAPSFLRQLLTLDLSQRQGRELRGFARNQMLMPILDESIWVEESAIRVNTPTDQLLLTDPEGLTVNSSWIRSLVFFSRTPNKSLANLRGWIDLPGPRTAPFPLVGNAYLFSHFGIPQTWEVQTINRSALMLVGAGIALIFGFVLVRSPLTRTPLTVLIAAFVLCVAAIWKTTPVLLFLQPLALGLALAVVVASLDRYFKRNQGPPVLTLPSAEESLLPIPGKEHDSRSDEFMMPQATVIQSTPMSQLESLQSDSGVSS